MLPLKPFKQSPSHCGPASLKMVFAYYGVKVSEKAIAKVAKTTQEAGTTANNLVKAAHHFGFTADVRNNCTLHQLEKWVEKQQIPVIASWFSVNTSHYSPIVDIDSKRVTLMDPETGRIRRIRKETFDDVWFDFVGSKPSRKNFRSKRAIIVHPQ